MCYPNLFKRIIPFAAALILGLFVASFFVNIVPTVKFERGRGPRHGRADYWDLKTENARLKMRVEELEQQNEVPCEDLDQAAIQDLLDRRCAGDELSREEINGHLKQLKEREKELKELVERLKKGEKQIK
jgi:hypothetical protein